jgi:hypothetical protein
LSRIAGFFAADRGDGGDGSGKNRLGQLLMELREELRAAEGPRPPK